MVFWCGGATLKSHCPCLKTTSYEHGWVTQKGGSWLPRMLTQSSHPILGFCVAPDKGTAYIWISVPLSGLYILITRILLILFHRQPIIIFIFHSSPTTNVHHQLYIHLSTFPLFLYSLEFMTITGSHTSSYLFNYDPEDPYLPYSKGSLQGNIHIHKSFW